ncbi:MAG: GNAT family N-acetyltransferase [Actinocatenispora sp.]
MNPRAVLAAFDEQIRRNPEAGSPDRHVERGGTVIRSVPAAGDGWAGVTWSDLNEHNADAAIAAQVHRFAQRPGSWEWKHYSYDQPADLPTRLVAAGFTPEPAETLLVAEIADLDLDVKPPEGVEIVPVHDGPGVAAVSSVHDVVFGGDHSALSRYLLAGLTARPSTVAAAVAMAGTTPVAAGRVEFSPGTDFASIWGGGTVREWRGRGVFRALVAHRACLAAERGFRYLQVDASTDSRPILRRLGFVELATTTPFVHPGGSS